MESYFGDDSFVPLKEGMYRLRVLAIVPTVWKGFGDAWEWSFEVVEGQPYAGCRLNGKTRRSPTPKINDKFGRWYRAVTGSRPKKGDRVDVQQLVGKVCWGLVTAGVSHRGTLSNNVDLIFGGPHEGNLYPA